MAVKTQFITRTMDTVVRMAQALDEINGLVGVYTARGYFAGGADPLTDADLTAAGICLTAVQFTTIVVPLLSDYKAFCENTAVATKDRKSDMNKARRDI